MRVKELLGPLTAVASHEPIAVNPNSRRDDHGTGVASTS